MSPADAEAVLRHQRQNDLPFGEAAMQLGIITQADVDFALARQYDYPYLIRGQSQVRESVIAAYEPFGLQVEALRTLRTHLLLRMPQRAACMRLAIVSAGKGDGRSHLAANLAVTFSQLGEKTLLIDGDMRESSQHALFGVDNRIGVSTLLAGRTLESAVHRIPQLVDLSLLPAGPKPPNPQELVGRPAFGTLLDEFSQKFDVVIVDTPAVESHAEALTIASRVGSALVVARKDSTRVANVRAMTRAMEEARIMMVGAVLNER
jgi:receptor protein-tyrosine kinase